LDHSVKLKVNLAKFAKKSEAFYKTKPLPKPVLRNYGPTGLGKETYADIVRSVPRSNFIPDHEVVSFGALFLPLKIHFLPLKAFCKSIEEDELKHEERGRKGGVWREGKSARKREKLRGVFLSENNLCGNAKY
ncbi:hypothetical protein Ancab_001490, partial [Ancistrocladus abbreviatus]